MDFIRHITIPKNTYAESPKIDYIALPPGVIRQVGYFFPLGCKGLAHLTIWHRTVQQWPRSQAYSYTGDNTQRNFPSDYILLEALNLLTIKTWNLDDTWQHTVTVHLTLLGEEQPSWVNSLLSLFVR